MKSETWIGRKEEQKKEDKGKRKGKEGTLGEAKGVESSRSRVPTAALIYGDRVSVMVRV